ncbi:hypothetical protein [Paenibacillus etheri]|uniref:hypothetical protein n=1 Tax=Paenibacillus etheri TaxID=1306852 RepID=UPI000ADD451D|nr:hypothetical protein [Paenibacillus etheri]
MNNRTKVQNPLTIIAIFAGIAEIAGTGVLLGLPLEIQKIFIWFVMLFPIGLVGLFFLVLLFNHKVLYAPSDFSNDQLFVDLLNKGKVQSVLKDATNIIQEAKEITQTASEDEQSPEETKLLGKLNTLTNMLESALQYNEENYEDVSSFLNAQGDSTNVQNLIIEQLEKVGSNGIWLDDLCKKISVSKGKVTILVQVLLNKGVIVKKNGKYMLKL